MFKKNVFCKNNGVVRNFYIIPTFKMSVFLIFLINLYISNNDFSNKFLATPIFLLSVCMYLYNKFTTNFPRHLLCNLSWLLFNLSFLDVPVYQNNVYWTLYNVLCNLKFEQTRLSKMMPYAIDEKIIGIHQTYPILWYCVICYPLSFLGGFTQVAWKFPGYLREPTEKREWTTNNTKS